MSLDSIGLTLLAAIVISVVIAFLTYDPKSSNSGPNSFDTLLDKKATLSEASDEPLKMTFVVRTDLKMGKGKIAAQVGHAVTDCVRESYDAQPALLRTWLTKYQKKLVLKCTGEAELMRLADAARAAGLTVVCVRDCGFTQVAANSMTCIGIGPAPEAAIDAVTGSLRLL